ncbi:MAG: nucleotide exchange factor GrpE [Prevotella sp.]|nr:nucleotide exchange factor GrpE [Prevotella sp.]
MSEKKETQEEMTNNDSLSQEEQAQGQQEGAQTAGTNADNQQKATEDGCEEGNREPEQTAEQNEEKDPLAVAEEKIAALKDQYLRTLAEFDNFKKRTLKEKAELMQNGSEKTITAILPVIDDMERAVANADKAESIETLEEGWELIYKKLLAALEKLGVRKIEADNQDFDVDYHEAIAMVPGMGDDKKGKVIDCVQTGYTLHDKVIRHAKVAVGQ